MEDQFDLMMDNDEAFYMYADGYGLLMWDLPIWDV